MPKYRLTAPHFSQDDKLLETGVEVGDGTPHAWNRPPTVNMEALDEESEGLLERERRRVGDNANPIENLPMTMGEAPLMTKEAFMQQVMKMVSAEDLQRMADEKSEEQDRVAKTEQAARDKRSVVSERDDPRRVGGPPARGIPSNTPDDRSRS